MAAPDCISDTPLGRSSSMDARDALSRSDSQQKSKSRRGPRSGNDLFVCFAPRTSLNLVSRPVLSPARERGREPGRRVRALSSSIFSKAAKKQGFEGEEPTSPKVTCIGQVRVRRKEGKAQESDCVPKSKQLRTKTTKTEPGSPVTADPASGSRKEHSSSVCPNFGKDFSCFGLPCDTYGSLPSFRGDKKSCGAVFAKSLVLIQETDGKRESKERALNQIELQLSSGEHIQGKRSNSQLIEKGDSAASLAAVDEDQTAASRLASEAASSQTTEERASKKQGEPVSHPSDEEDDTFETEPPPPNALLLMRHKVQNLRVVVPPPSVNITLKRSTSAPAQCRVQRSCSSGDDEGQSETDLPCGKETGLPENDLQKRSKETVSAEDFPKNASSSSMQKSFLKRCKSVSQSLIRSSTGAPEAQASVLHNTAALSEKEEAEAVPQEVMNQRNETSEAAAKRMEELKQEDEQALTDFVNAASSRRRSDSEALKISLDVVPETWLWQSCTIVRPPKDSLSHEREKRFDRHKTEWLDAELEASLWKSCKVGDHLKGSEATSQETSTEWLDAEVEATLWRSCRVASTSQEEDHFQNVCPSGEAETEVGESNFRRSASLNRSSSVGSQRACTEVEEKESGPGEGDEESPGISCGFLHAVEMNDSHLEETARVLQDAAVGTSGICLVSQEDGAVETGSGKKSSSTVSEELDDHQTLSRETVGKCQGEAEALKQEKVQHQELEQKISTEAQGTSTPSPVASAPDQVTTPAADTLLFVSYNMKAFRISLDASDSIFTDSEEVPLQSEDQQQAMLKAMSHLHEVGTYARLLKAASGKERASLSSAFRLQRCKSEPVRLTT